MSDVPMIYALRTGEEYYAVAACALQGDCYRLNLAFQEISVPNLGRRRATHLKPRAMLMALGVEDRPIWWLDVDAKLKAKPPAMKPTDWIGFHYQPDKAGLPIRSSVFYLTPTPRCVNFLANWVKECAKPKYGPSITDHSPLCRVFEQVLERDGMALMDTNGWQWTNGFRGLPHP